MTVSPEFKAEILRRVDLVELIHASGLVDKWRPGRAGEFKGICPFHQERTPSFYVIGHKRFWHCFGCSAHGDAIAWVMRTTTARDFPEAVEYLAARVGLSQTGPALDRKPIDKRPADDMRADDEAKRIAAAREIWAGHSVATQWTPAGLYLQGRRIGIELPPTIGYHAACPHPYLRYAKFPAMVAPVQNVERRIVGVHCTFLAQFERGRWGKMPPPPGWPPDEAWKAKIMRGVCRKGAVRLTPAEDLMVIAEGLETSLSVLQALYDDEVKAPHIDGEPVGVWAALSLDNMGMIELPDGVREVILAGDGDGKLPAADDAVRKDPDELLEAAAARHRDLGRNVRIARPPAGVDFNDMVPDGAAGAIAGAEGLSQEATA